MLLVCVCVRALGRQTPLDAPSPSPSRDNRDHYYEMIEIIITRRDHLPVAFGEGEGEGEGEVKCPNIKIY